MKSNSKVYEIWKLISQVFTLSNLFFAEIGALVRDSKNLLNEVFIQKGTFLMKKCQ